MATSPEQISKSDFETGIGNGHSIDRTQIGKVGRGHRDTSEAVFGYCPLIARRG